MKVRVLVADDFPLMRSLLMDSLRSSGIATFEFDEAGDGNEALARFHPDKTDLALVDWNMPKLSGMAFIKRIGADAVAKQIPIVMVTGETSMGRIDEALRDPAVSEYITKPFTVNEIRAKLGPLIERIVTRKQEAAAATPRRGGLFSLLR